MGAALRFIGRVLAGTVAIIIFGVFLPLLVRYLVDPSSFDTTPSEQPQQQRAPLPMPRLLYTPVVPVSQRTAVPVSLPTVVPVSLPTAVPVTEPTLVEWAPTVVPASPAEPVAVAEEVVVLPAFLYYDTYPAFSTENECEYDEAGQLIGAVTTITIPPPSDPGPDPLTYTWSASNGSISGSGLTAIWTREIEEGLLVGSWRLVGGEVAVTVSDGRGSYTFTLALIISGPCE